jgi:YD repeat-containing protein
LRYDANGQLTRIALPAVGGVSPNTQFSYNAQGEVVTVTDAQGRIVEMLYDIHGNQVYLRDAFGNTTRRSFNGLNQVVAETMYLTPDPDGAGPVTESNGRTTRYYYDVQSAPGSPGALRFVISPEGRINELRYNAQGQRVASLDYAAQTINPGQLTGGESASVIAARVWTATPEADLAAISRRDIRRTDMEYDVHGQLAAVTHYAQVLSDTNSTGVADGSTTTRYIYDQAGQLLSKVDSATATQTSYTYDGLGRVLTIGSGLGATSVTQYDDAGNRTVVTNGDGAATTSAYDRAGRLISVAQSGAEGSTRYFYDADGRQSMAQDAAGLRTWTYYDAAGRKSADV